MRASKWALLLICTVGYCHDTIAFVTSPSRALLLTRYGKIKSVPQPFASTPFYATEPNYKKSEGNYLSEESNNVTTHEDDNPIMQSTSEFVIATNNGIEDEDTAVFVTQEDVWKARSLLIAAAALYGTNFSLVKLLGDVMPEGVSLTIRFTLASLVTLPWLFDGDIFDATSGSIDPDILRAIWLGFEVGLWNSIGYVAQAVGLETTQASKSAFICSLAVVVVPLLNFFSRSKSIQTRQWIGAILAVIGVAFLELSGGVGATTTSATTSGLSLSIGDILSLVQPLAFGIGFWRIENALHQYPAEARRLTAAQLLAVFLASFCYGLSAIDAPTLASMSWSKLLSSPVIIFSLFWTGVITTALTIFMENKAMETLSAAEATVIFATEPLWGTIFAATVMGEQLGVNSIIGAAFIMSACFYSNLGSDGIIRAAKQINEDARQVPAKLQNQWASFATSVAASWASWNVAVANAADTLPDMEELDDIIDALENIVCDVFENLPW